VTYHGIDGTTGGQNAKIKVEGAQPKTFRGIYLVILGG